MTKKNQTAKKSSCACPYCDEETTTESPAAIPFCKPCGFKFSACAKCGESIAISAVVCPKCGEKIKK